MQHAFRQGRENGNCDGESRCGKQGKQCSGSADGSLASEELAG
jgi:hypothetical protein